MPPESDTDPATRPLGWISASNLVIASMIGAGIFSTSGYLAEWLHSGTLLIWAWIVAYSLVQPEGWRPAVASFATIALGLILRPLVRQRGREGLIP